MARSRAAVAVGALALASAAILIPVYAHEGHGKPTGATFDPNAPKKVSEATATAIGLATAEVDFGQVEDVVRLTGMVRARPDALFAVSPRYAGVVRSIAVQPGDRVSRGTPLAEVESPEIAKLLYDLKRLEADTERLSADLKRAESQVASLEIEVPALTQGADIADAEVQRLTSAGESVSANLMAQRKSEAIKLRADAGLRRVALEQAKADVESLRRQAESTRASAEALRGTLPNGGGEQATELLADPTRPGVVRFVSPIEGVVTARTAVAGEGVDAGRAIVTVGEFSRVQIEGELPEGLVDRIAGAADSKVRIRRGVGATSEVVAEGTVRFVSPVIDATKRTAHVIVDADNAAGLLRQGQFVDLSVVVGSNESAVVIPASAIVKEGPMQFVFVREGKDENITYKKRDIATGVRDDRVVEITQGLVPGDVIAVSGAFSLSQLRGFVPAAPEPAAPVKSDDGHGHSH
ncbi:MAG: efflux RND transporter periplasmic adaptor subunit [Phycisphaerales bacterium]